MDIRLYVPRYHDSVFVTVLESGTPEPVLVMLLSLLPVSEHIQVEVENDGREYDIHKVYQADLGDYDAVDVFTVAVKSKSEDFQRTYTYILWVANGEALGLFRLIMNNSECVGLERAHDFGKSWSPWACRANETWNGTEDDKICGFAVQRIGSAVDNYVEEIVSE